MLGATGGPGGGGGSPPSRGLEFREMASAYAIGSVFVLEEVVEII